MAMLNSTKPVLVGLALLLFVAAAACSSGDNGGSETGAAAAAAGDTEAAPEAGAEGEYALAQQFELSITVTSTKFNETRRIPRKYSCTEEDVSPPITWGDVPDGTVSLALMVDSDQRPGALWGHWVLWGIPPDARVLPEEIPNMPRRARRRPQGGPGHQRRQYDRLVRALSRDAEAQLPAGPRRRPHKGGEQLLLPALRPGRRSRPGARGHEVGLPAGDRRPRPRRRRAPG